LWAEFDAKGALDCEKKHPFISIYGVQVVSGKYWKLRIDKHMELTHFLYFFCPSFEDSNDSNVQMDLEATATRTCWLRTPMLTS